MKLAKPGVAAWAVTIAWNVIGLAVAVWFRLWSSETPLAYLAVLLLAALIIGLATGYFLDTAARLAGGLLTGGVLGQMAVALPAIQLGQWAATVAVELAAPVALSSLALPLYGAALAITATVVLLLATILGMTVQAALRWALRPLLPRSLGWRPGWRAMRIAVLLLLLGGALIHADRRVGLPWPEAKPPQASAWLEREKALFRDVLAHEQYDLVVLPMQADGPTLDRIARSLMTRQLAQRTQERTAGRLPDPTLLARALGSRERSLDLEDALSFSRSLGARTAVVSSVHRAGQTFTVRAAVWTRDGERWRESRAASLQKLEFGDRLPPAVVFREALQPLLERLDLGNARRGQPSGPAAGDAAPIRDLLRLASSDVASVAERAVALQLFASLHERDSLEAETLWERSLIALSGGGASELERTLEARAYLHLYRRPYALRRLGQPVSPAGRALLATLNGNVPAAEAAAAAIEEPALRLMAEIELADLYDYYGLDTRLVARRKQLLETPLTDAALLRLRLSAPDWFAERTHGDIADALARAIPVDLDWHEYGATWLRWLYMVPDPLDSHELRLARSIERRLEPLWKAKAGDWAGRRAADRLAEWDYYDLLFASNRQALLKAVHGTLHKQALPGHAREMIETLGELFAGYPRLMYFHAWALDRIGRDARPGPRQRLFSRSSALAASAYRWEGGESHLSQAVEYYIYERNYQKYLDEPLRWYRVAVPGQRLQVERLSYGAREIEREIAAARRRLEYSDRGTAPLRDLVRWLQRAGRVEEALGVMEANRHRFVGSLDRAALLAEAEAVAGKSGDALAAYREILELDPGSSEARERVARAYMESGKTTEAQKTYLAHPGFANHEGQNVVGLANYAFRAGFYFYRRGEPQLAMPLFAQSTRLRTGSSSELHARELLAIMENDLGAALKLTRYQIDRYGDAAAAARQLIYLFSLGRKDQAWAQFSDFASRFGTEEVWMAAFIAHRMQGVQGTELERWLSQEAARDTRRDFLMGALRERHAFQLALIDRPPTDEALAVVRAATQTNYRSPFYPQIAEGYIAFRKGDFAGAAQKLRGPHGDLFNISISRRESLSELLPFMVFALARSGQRPEAGRLLSDHLTSIGIDSDYLVARALLEASANDHESAAASLRLAFNRLPRAGTRAFFPGYVLLQACELLLTQSNNATYRELIETFARRLQVEVPHGWAAAFEAKYARDLDRRQLALAVASLLDPRSERIAHFPDAERQSLQGAAARHGSVLGAALRTKQR